MNHAVVSRQNEVFIFGNVGNLQTTKPEALLIAIDILQTAIAEGWIDPETIAKVQSVIDEA